MTLVMRYFALACDYDGTIASHGRVDGATLSAIERLRASGRRLLLVTGRELDDLMRAFPHVHLFDRIVAENGAVVYEPGTRDVQALAEAPPVEFVRELERRGVTPLSVGRVIVATWEPHDAIALQVIHEMGLELQVTFNKGAVMLLPSGGQQGHRTAEGARGAEIIPRITSSASVMPRTTTLFWPRVSAPLPSRMRSTASRRVQTSSQPRNTVQVWCS